MQEATNYYRPSMLPPSQTTKKFPVDMALYWEWRSQMITWQYSLASTCDFQKDTVEISLSIVDRFVAVQNELLFQARRYQAACMTALYIAAKIHEPQCLTPNQMEQLSVGRFKASEIEAMEIEILQAIQWRVNPPTAGYFCRMLLELVPIDGNMNMNMNVNVNMNMERTRQGPFDRATVLQVAESYIALALGEVSLLRESTFSLGLASLCNALRCVLGQSNVDPFFLDLHDNIDLFHMDRLESELRSLVIRSLSSGMVLHPALAACHAYSPDDEQTVVDHDGCSSNSKTERSSPRGVGALRRYVSVLLG